MYVIVEIQGQQFKVENGKKLFVHYLGAEHGAVLEFDKVLLVDKDGAVTVGTPTVEGAKVVCEVVSNDWVSKFSVVNMPKPETSWYVKEVQFITRVKTWVWARITPCLLW